MFPKIKHRKKVKYKPFFNKDWRNNRQKYHIAKNRNKIHRNADFQRDVERHSKCTNVHLIKLNLSIRGRVGKKYWSTNLYNMKKYWQVLNGSKERHTGKYIGPIEELFEHSSVLSGTREYETSPEEAKINIYEEAMTILNYAFTEEEIQTKVKQLKTDKVTGEDRIKNGNIVIKLTFFKDIYKVI